MRRDRAAVWQREMFDEDGSPIGQFADQAFRPGGVCVEIRGADVETPTLAPQLQEFGPGHGWRQIRARQAVDFEIAVVAEHDPLLRIGHDDALVQMIQRRADERILAQMRAFDPAQRRMDPQCDRREKCADHDAADQHFPHHAGIGIAKVGCRRELPGKRPRGAKRRNAGGQAHDSLRKNQIHAACLPVLVSHQSPADLAGSVWLRRFGSGKRVPLRFANAC